MKKGLILFIALIVVAVVSLSAITIFATSEEQTHALTIVSNTLELENAVFMNFKVDAQGFDDTSAIKLLVWESAPEEYTKDTAYLTLSPDHTEKDTSYIVFQYDDLAAKDMTKFVYVCAYAECDGEAVYSKPVKFSILQYAYNTLITGTAPEYLEGILTNMLEYGAFSQLYFDHNTDFLATDEVAKIKVVNGTHADGFKTGYYKAGTSVTLTANEAEDGYVFSHWEDSEGAEVGTETTLTIPECSSNTYTAVYVEEIKYSEGLAFTSNGDGTCYVSGIGTCTDTDIVIPPTSLEGDKVVEIGEWALSYNSNLNSVVMPDTVLSISSYAFQKCDNLNKVTISKNLKTIDNGAFSSCRSLISISLPEGVTSLGDSVFYECYGLTHLSIPSSVQMIGNDAFYGCKLIYNEFDNVNYLGNANNPYVVLVKVKDKSLACSINSSTKIIYESAFSGYNMFTEVSLPEDVRSICNAAFHSCVNLESVTIGNRVTHIGDAAFANCSKLKRVALSDSLSEIGTDAFYGCSNLHYHDFENGKYLGSENNNYLVLVKAKDTTITTCAINDTTKIVLSKAFSGCTSLSNVIIPNGVKIIGEKAFENCHGLICVAIPNSVDKIGRSVFNGCTSLESITVPFVGPERYATERTHFGYLFGASDYSYNKAVIPSSLSTVVVTDGYQIDSWAFYNCSSITNIIIHDGVISVGDNAFYNCVNLINISIPSTLETLGVNVFYGCEKIIYNSYDNAYYLGNASNPYVILTKSKDKLIESCDINAATKFIYDEAFGDCNNLKSIILPDNVLGIGIFSFSHCNSLTNLRMSANVKIIHQSAFWYCTSLTDIQIPNGVIHIGNNAFTGCFALTNIIIPNSVVTLGNHAFSYCQGLQSITIGGGVKNFGDEVFYRCYDLETVIICDGVSTIGDVAFYDCSKLKTIFIPKSITTIGGSAFSSCINCSEVYYNGSQEDWEKITIESNNTPLINAKKCFDYQAE